MTVASLSLHAGGPSGGPSGAPALVQTVLARLTKVRRSGKGWLACCPAHGDRDPSLSVSAGRDGRVVVHCHKGCAPTAVVAAIGLEMGDLFPDTARAVLPPYTPPPATPRATAEPRAATEALRDDLRWEVVDTFDYVDADGQLLFQVQRKHGYAPDGTRRKKDFPTRRPDGRGGWAYNLDGVEQRPLYRLPQVIEAAAGERLIYVVEGEQCVHALEEAGYVATTNPQGSLKWRPEHTAALAGATVVILPDHDENGRTHAEQVAAALADATCAVKVVELPGLPPKGDVVDWLEAGHTLDELDALVSAAPRWRPAAERDKPRVYWRLDELWEDEALMRPPPPIVPRFAWASRSTLLASAEKAGKSTLCGAMVAAVSRGWPLLDPDEPCQRGDALVFGLEEFVGDIGRRLKGMHADPKHVHIVTSLLDEPKARLDELRGYIERIRPVLVIVDTLMAYVEGQISDASSSSQMQPIVQRLTRLAHETDVALILVHHARKADGRYRDSSAIGGAVDAIIEVFNPSDLAPPTGGSRQGRPDDDAPPADPTLRRTRARGRVPVRDCAFRWDGAWYHLVPGPTATIEDRVLEFIRANPGASANQIRKAIGGRHESTDLAINALLSAGRIYDESPAGSRTSAYVASYRTPSRQSAPTSPDPRPGSHAGDPRPA